MTHTRKKRTKPYKFCSLCRGNRFVYPYPGARFTVRCKCMEKPQGVDRKSQGAGID